MCTSKIRRQDVRAPVKCDCHLIFGRPDWQRGMTAIILRVRSILQGPSSGLETFRLQSILWYYQRSHGRGRTSKPTLHSCPVISYLMMRWPLARLIEVVAVIRVVEGLTDHVTIICTLCGGYKRKKSHQNYHLGPRHLTPKMSRYLKIHIRRPLIFSTIRNMSVFPTLFYSIIPLVTHYPVEHPPCIAR